MPNLDLRYIVDEKTGQRVLPITHVNAVRDSNGNTLPTLMAPEKNGSGIGTCSTSSGTALVVSLTNYELIQNGFIAVTFENDVPANATLNVNGKGAKPIYYKGAAIEADTIKADDTVMFAYDGTNYVVTSLGGENGGSSAAGLEIVAASGTTLTAEAGKYYRYDSDVTNLTVTLPTIIGATNIQNIELYLKTGSTLPSILFTGGTMKKLGNFELLTNNNYEIDCKWNGSLWTLQANGSVPYDSKIEYLQDSGTQYIDSLVSVNQNSAIYVKFMLISGGNLLWGQDMSSNWYEDWNLGTDGAKISYCVASYSPLYPFNYSYNTMYEAYADKDGITFNGTTYSKSLSSSYVGNKNLYIFATNRGTPITVGEGVCRIYNFTVYQEGSMVLNLVPVRIGTTGYMYDVISGKLLGNSGTGSFTLGPDV